MINGAPPVAAEILSLAELLGIPCEKFRHVVAGAGVLLLTPGSDDDLVNVSVPDGFFFIITSLEVSAYPQDAAGTPNYENRQPGYYSDDFDVYIIFRGEKEHQAIQQWPNLYGNILLAYSPGTVAVHVAHANDSTSVATTIRLAGYLVAAPMPALLSFMTTRSLTPT